MNGQVDRGALEDFLAGKGLLGEPAEKELYNFTAAEAAGYGPDETGHWPSRVEKGIDEGLILKDIRHPTFAETFKAEKALGNEFYEEEGRLFSFSPSDPILQDPKRTLKMRPLPVTVQGRAKTPYIELLARFLESKGQEVKLPELPPQERGIMAPLPVTDPRAPTREQIGAGAGEKFSFLREVGGLLPGFFGKAAPAPGMDLLPPGPEIPTPEPRPQEITDRPADFVPPRGWWQQVKDVAFLLKNFDLNAMSIVSRGLLKGLTFGTVDPIKMVEKISGVQGFAAEYYAVEKEKFQKITGYTPTVAVEVPARVGEFVGSLVPFSRILKGAGAAVKGLVGKKLIRNIPAFKALARAELTGTALGLAVKPEEEGLLNRLKQVPASVAFFTVLDMGILSAQHVLKAVRYARAAKTYKRVDWNAIVDPPGATTYTADDIKNIFNKLEGNTRGGVARVLTKDEEAIMDYFKEWGRLKGVDPVTGKTSSNWAISMRRGWEAPEGVLPEQPWMTTGDISGLPRKPRFFDMFREGPLAPFEPGFEPPAKRPKAPREAAAPPPPTEPAPTAAQAAAQPRRKARPTPRKAGVPAVVVDVEPKPGGGWTYNFKIPTAAPAVPAEPLTIDWKPPAGILPEAKIPPVKPLVTPAPGEKVKVIKPRKAKVFSNPIYQFLNLAGGVKPTRDYPYESLKGILPFDLIDKSGSALDIHAQAMTVEFPKITEDSELFDELTRMAETQRDAKVTFRNVVTGEETSAPREFYSEEIDEAILDQIGKGNADQLDPEDIDRARELLAEIDPGVDPEIGLEEGVAKIKEIMRKRRAAAEKEILAEEKLPEFVTEVPEKVPAELEAEEGFITLSQKQFKQIRKQAEEAVGGKITPFGDSTKQVKAIIAGKKPVAFFSSDEYEGIADLVLDSPELETEDIGLRMYVFREDNIADAKRRISKLEKLKDNEDISVEQQAREVGKLLGYSDKDVETFVDNRRRIRAAFGAEKPEEFKLKREEVVKPKKPAPKKEEPTLIKKAELKKPPGKYPEEFDTAGLMEVPKYQGTLKAANKAAAAGFDVEYGPAGKVDKGYVRIVGPAKGKIGTRKFISLADAPPKFGKPVGQLGIDFEGPGELLGRKGLNPKELEKTLDKLNIPAEHRGEISISALENFDPNVGKLENYIRKIEANISKRKGPEKAARLKEQKKIKEEEISKEPTPSARFDEAQAEIDILESIERATKNKKEVEILRRRILDEDSFEEIGKTMKISTQRAQKVFADIIVKLKEDPTVIKMLEGRYKEVHAGPTPKWKDIKKIANTYFTSSKGMSKQIDAANDKRVQNPIADLFLTTLEGQEVSRWIQKNDNAGLRQQVKELLTGELSFDNIALPENVPEVALKSLRKRIDDLSTLIMAHGGLKESTLAAFESGIGKYLGTFYRLHEYNELNKGKLIKQYWDPPQEARDRFAAALRKDDPGGFADFTDETMDNFLDSMLRGEDYVYRGSNRTKRVPTEHYKSQVGVSKEYEEFAGIITDPVWLALRTVTKQTVMAHNAQFLNTMEENPEIAKMITRDLETARGRGWMGHQLPNDYSYGRLKGAWVHPELDKFIRGEINPQMSATERMIMKFIMNPFKATKTIWSVPTHARNITGGVMFSFLMQTSVFNPFNAPYYWEILRIWMGRKGKMRNEWAELIRNGVTETQFFKSEIPDLYNELLRLDPPDWPEKIFSWAARKPANALGELYNFEDVLYRGAAYLKQIKHFKKTPQEAVDLVNLSSPNYRKVPIAVEWLRRYPALGPFISFRFNVARILSNNAIRAGKEISSKDPKKKIEGWLRIYRLAFIIGFPLLLAKISAKVFDVDEKKVKELEKTYPSYKRGGTIIYFRGKEGQLKGYDFTYTYPTGDITKAINNLIGGDTDSFSEDVQLFAHPIFDAYSILVKGEDPYWRTPIKDPLMRRVTELVKLLWLPQSAPIPSIQGLVEGIKTGKIGENIRVGKLTTYQIESMIQAYQKQEDRYGRVRKLPEELKNFFTGVRTWDINPQVLIVQYIKQKQFALDDAERTYKSWLRRNTQAAYWQIEEQQALLERKRAKIYGDIEHVGKLLESMDPTFHLRKSGRFE